MSEFYVKQVTYYENGFESSTFHQFDSKERKDEFIGKKFVPKAKYANVTGGGDIGVFTSAKNGVTNIKRMSVTKKQMLNEIGNHKVIKHSFMDVPKKPQEEPVAEEVKDVKETEVKKASDKKLILRVEDNQVFSTMADALESVGVNRSNRKPISKILKNGEDREYHGYHWKYI